MNAGGAVTPFFGASLGAARFAAADTSLSDVWRFAVGLNLGLKAAVNPRFGLRGQARLLLPIYFSGGGVWCGTAGCTAGVSGGVPIVQGDVQGGAYVAF